MPGSPQVLPIIPGVAVDEKLLASDVVSASSASDTAESPPFNSVGLHLHPESDAEESKKDR